MSRRYSNELIEQIKEANDIVNVISEYVPLKKKGRNYWGCCPFHNEKTPSFSVTPEKGFYYCFGCHASGTVINFLMQEEGLSFPEALGKLAERAGIPLPEEELTDVERRQNEKRRRLYEINELAANFFHNCLTKTEMGKVGLEYFQKRGLSRETIDKFRLGYAPDSWDKLYRAFTERKIPEAYLLKLGLVRKNDNGRVYDYFRNRVMFPICDGKGRVVGFGGRVLDDSTPKYLNSPETEIFNKGHLLFAFDKAYKTIRRTKQAILVEGYMDVISAHNAGVTNVVASLGTAYTKDHGRLLMRQAEEIILAYDMDGAGRKAVRRAIDLLQNTDFKVRVLAMPDGKDPDDYVRNHGRDGFLTIIDKAIPPFEFLLNQAMIGHDSTDMAGKQAILDELFPFISHTENSVKRDSYLRALALPLWLDMGTIRQSFKEFTRRGRITLVSEAQPVKTLIEPDSDETYIVAQAVQFPKAWQMVHDYVEDKDIVQEVYRTLLATCGKVLQETGGLSSAALETVLSEEEKTAYSRLLVLTDTQFDEIRLEESIRRLRIQSLRRQYKEHSIAADKMSRAGDTAFIEELKKCQEIQKEIQEWS